MLQWSLAAIHLLAFGIGLGAIWGRARALAGPLDAAGLRRVFRADGFWGGAAFLWLSTGVWRAFGGVEKGTAYYMHNWLFHTKLTLFVAILLLELWPMITLIRWRQLARRGQVPDLSPATSMSRISAVQVVLIVLMVLAASGMARGFGIIGGR